MVIAIAGLFMMGLSLFAAPVKTYACERGTEKQIILKGVDTEGSSIPTEVKEPIEKGESFIIFLVTRFGGIALLIGIVLAAIAWLGHQPEMKLTSVIFVGVGILLAFGPRIADWFVPSLNWY